MRKIEVVTLRQYGIEIRKDITFGKDQPHILLKLLTWVKTFTLGGRFPDLAEGELLWYFVILWSKINVLAIIKQVLIGKND